MEANVSIIFKQEDISMESEIIEDKLSIQIEHNENEVDKKDIELTEENDNRNTPAPYGKRNSEKRENLFACNLCEKSFSTSDKLNEHISFHFERPFKV